VVDLIDFVSLSLIKRPPPIMEKYKHLKDGESVEEPVEEDASRSKGKKPIREMVRKNKIPCTE
jgi:hypothetical protein